MKLVLIASAVDHGTRAICSAFERELNPSETVLLEHDIRGMNIVDWLKLRSKIRESTKNADVVLCGNHGAVIAGGLLLAQCNQRRIVGFLDWSRQYPSRRRDLKIRLYATFLNRILKRFSAVCSPVQGMRDFYLPSVRMLPILYPLPYPEVDLKTHEPTEDGITKLLFIGADIQRKGGDVLLNQWHQQAPDTARLTFVTPRTPDGAWRNVKFLNDIKPFTPAHRQLLESHQIFILPSHREAYGYAALEALNFGHVVVTTARAGIAGLVAEAGGIVGDTPDDTVRLAMELLNQPDEIERRQKACRDFMAGYQQRFDERMRDALGGSRDQ